MWTTTKTERGWEVRHGEVLYGTYPTEAEARRTADEMGRHDWN